MTPEVELPDVARRYLLRAHVGRGEKPTAVRVGQEGEMWLKPGGRALAFTAVEELAVDRVAFTWRAAFRLGPLPVLRVIDGFADGEGALEARFLRLRVMSQSGADVSVGEAMRYLAELPWAPHAIGLNHQLRWLELDAHTVEVSTAVGSRTAAVRLHFDLSGDIAAASAESRPFPRGKTTTPMPWEGSFSDYAEVGGVRLPRQAEVRWELPEGAFTYWRGRITSFEKERVLIPRHLTEEVR